MVKITEGSPENTLWYCRYCGGGLAVTDIKVAANHGDGLDTGDKVFNEELNADELQSVVKLKLTETHHLTFTKVIVESDLHEGATQVKALSHIFSDESEKQFEKELPALKYEADVKLYFAEHTWKPTDRTWATYPSEVMNELTTLEETKP